MKKFVHEPLNKNSLSSNGIYSLHRDNEGVLWIGTVAALHRFNAADNSFIRYQNNPNDIKSITDGPIWAIKDAGGDALWIATSTGLELMDKKTGTFVHFKNNPKDTNSLSSDFITTLFTDTLGNVWIGANLGGGLNYLDRRTGKFTRFLKGSSIFTILKDVRGTIWVGTDAALYKSTNPFSSGFTRFNDPGSGIGITTVVSLQEDNQKNVWAATSNGIYKINPITNQTKVYAANYGVNNVNGFGFGYKDTQGQIYFSHEGGYYVLSPEQLVTNTTPPQVAVIDFRVSGKSIGALNTEDSGTLLQNGKEVVLKYNQNAFSFEFAGVHTAAQSIIARCINLRIMILFGGMPVLKERLIIIMYRRAAISYI